MSPILSGIGGVSVRGFGHFPNLYFSSFDSIATVTVGSGGVSTIDITSIPQTYTHLQLRIFTRVTRSTYNVDEIYVYCNSDTTASNYAGHYMWPQNNNFPGTVVAGGAANFVTPYIVSTNTGTGGYAGQIIDILDYTNTNKYKTIRGLGGADANGDLNSYTAMGNFNSALWKNTNAITSLNIRLAVGTSFNEYSSFALYGIKGA